VTDFIVWALAGVAVVRFLFDLVELFGL